MTSIDDDPDPQVQELERMKSDFLVAQQRRRERAASRPGHTSDGDGPPPARPYRLRSASLTPCRM